MRIKYFLHAVFLKKRSTQFLQPYILKIIGGKKINYSGKFLKISMETQVTYVLQINICTWRIYLICGNLTTRFCCVAHLQEF